MTVYGTSNPLDTSGVFTCREPGLYKFQLYCFTQQNTSVFLEIYHNQELVSSALSRSTNGYADAANAFILNLAVGDTVYVKNLADIYTYFYGSPGQIYTTFTGVQVSNMRTGDTDPSHNVPSFSVAVTLQKAVRGGRVVIFDKITLDNTNAYDKSTGIYTASSPGVYVFHFFTLSYPYLAVWLELYHNNDYVCAIYSNGPAQYANAGNTAILNLKAGDMVQVKARQGNDAQLLGNAYEIYTTFSGTRIATEVTDRRAVAFSAGLTRTVTVPENRKVLFDKIITDLHHNYDSNTGDFTAPMRGAYEFNFHALGRYNHVLWLDLYRNDRYVNSLYSSVTGDYPNGGNAAVIDLDVGDVVYVKARSGTMFGASDQVYCTFSGYLITGSIGSSPAVG